MTKDKTDGNKTWRCFNFQNFVWKNTSNQLNIGGSLSLTGKGGGLYVCKQDLK